MVNMFYQAEAFNQHIGDWHVSSSTTLTGMFFDATAWKATFVRDDASSDDGPPQSWSLKPGLCGENHRVSNGACVPCAAGYAQPPGDDPLGGDTTCSVCAKGHHVSNGACAPCPFDFIGYGANPAGGDTPCRDLRRVFATLEDLKAAVASCAGACEEAKFWDVSQLTSLREAFKDATTFNADISGWDVSRVTDMGWMFNRAYAFNQPIGGWNVSSVTHMNHMFWGRGHSTSRSGTGTCPR